MSCPAGLDHTAASMFRISFRRSSIRIGFTDLGGTYTCLPGGMCMCTASTSALPATESLSVNRSPKRNSTRSTERGISWENGLLSRRSSLRPERDLNSSNSGQYPWDSVSQARDCPQTLLGLHRVFCSGKNGSLPRLRRY